jgi:hypothetical protein
MKIVLPDAALAVSQKSRSGFWHRVRGFHLLLKIFKKPRIGA